MKTQNSGIWHCVTGWVVFYVLKDHIALTGLLSPVEQGSMILQKIRDALTTAKCHNPENVSRNQYCCENFESCKTNLVFCRSVHDIMYISLLPCQEIRLQQHWPTHRRWFPSTLESASPALLQPTAWYHNSTKFAP